MIKLNLQAQLTLTLLIISTVAFSENQQLTKLKASREKAIAVEKKKFDKSKRMINDYYLKKLKLMMTVYTKKGDLDTALEIKAEIKAIESSASVTSNTKNIFDEKEYKNALKLHIHDILDNNKIKILNKDIKIFADFISQNDNGVILAHGGTAAGYALYLKNGRVILASKFAGRCTTVESKPIKKGTVAIVEAVIRKNGTLSLKVNNGPAVSKRANPLKQPKEPLSVGRDVQKKVAPYQNEEFQGTIKQLLLKLD